MIIDIAIVALLILFTVSGSLCGLRRGLCALVAPVAGVLFALKTYGSIAPTINRVLHSYGVSVVAAFLFVIVLTWLGSRLLRTLLLKLVDWNRLSDLDYFLGGVFGLARGLAVVWVTLALVLTAFPPSYNVLQHSIASTRVLALAEHLAGNGPGRGRLIPKVQKTTGSIANTIASFRQILNPFQPADEQWARRLETASPEGF